MNWAELEFIENAGACTYIQNNDKNTKKMLIFDPSNLKWLRSNAKIVVLFLKPKNMVSKCGKYV